MKLKETIEQEDVKNLGLVCGLEIHQQLEGRKLFARTPTLIRDDNAHFQIKRFLRASAGESGIVDKAAAAEQKKQKYYVYEGYFDTTGLVELDEEPPAPPSKKAVRASLQAASLLNMYVIDEVRFMRKIVVNGSNTSGFQRTGLIAVNGEIETQQGKVGIDSLCLEEDSAKDVEKAQEYTIYNLSRLGIPLIEIATAPDIFYPEQAKEVAEHLGMLLRSLENVKRGLGTIRQDVNVSIQKGKRVEIKGAQDLKMIPELVRQEMLRQYNLLEICSELKKRNAQVGSMINVTEQLKASESKVVKRGLEKDGVALAVALLNYKGLLGAQIQIGRRFGSELSDYAKVMGVKGLFHSDELPNYGITQDEKDAISRELHLGPNDAFVLIIEQSQIATRAMEAVIERLADLDVKKEVRMARPDGSSSYMRPMPGAARMYPETDVRPLALDVSDLEVPKLLTQRIKEIASQLDLEEDIVKKLIRDDIDIISYKDTYPELKVTTMIDIIYSLPQLILKNHKIEISLQDHVDQIFEKLNSNKITKDSLEQVAIDLHNGSIDWNKYKPLDISIIEEDVRKFIKPIKDKPLGAIMGQVMGKYKGKIDGKQLSNLVLKLIKE